LSDKPFSVDGAEKRRQIIRVITELHAQLNRWPTPDEVAARLGIPRKTLQYHTRILVKERRLRRLFGGRALEVLDNPVNHIEPAP